MTKKLQTYLVGGAVRDELLGLSVSDRDWVVVGATIEQLLDDGFQQIGSDFPCFLHPKTKEEYSLARTERKSGSGHTGFVCDFHENITLEEDLLRRDLTINAIAKTIEGEYIDPYGGRADLEAKVLRHVSDAFVEDPLRVLRVARFAARFYDLGFTVHPDTMALMKSLVDSGELDSLTAERVWKEMLQALSTTKPSEFFLVLRECGALEVLLPEVEALFGVPQPQEHHPEIDTGTHVMMVVDKARYLFNTTQVTWAALMHDLGKGITSEDKWPQHICHEINGVPLVKEACQRYKIPKDYLRLSLLVCEHHLRCHKVLEMKPNKILRLLEELDAFRRPEQLKQFVQACEADAKGRMGFEDKEYPQADMLLNCANIAKNVDIKSLQDEGYENLKLAEQIRHLRVSAIRDYI